MAASALPRTSAATPRVAAGGGGLRTYGLACLFLSPWIVGFFVFLLYPMVASLYFSFTHYDLLNSPRWIGLANYRYMLHDDPFFWQAVRNTGWMIVIGLPLRLFWALLTATMLTQRVRGQRYYRTLYYLPGHGAARRRRAGLHIPAESRHRAGQRRARALRHPRATVVLRPGLVETRARPARAVGRGRRDDHLPRRAARRAARPRSRPPRSTAPAPCAATGTSRSPRSRR